MKHIIKGYFYLRFSKHAQYEITELNKITLIFTKLKMEIPRSREKIIGSKVIVYFPLIVCLAKGHLKAYMCYTNSSPLKS